MNRTFKISEHFSSVEFECRCGCGLLMVNPALVKMLERVRTIIDKPMIVHCVCRCHEHNMAVGGSENSQHLPIHECRAMDFHVRGMSNRKLRKIAKRLWHEDVITGGLGLYSWGVHVDVGRKRKWGKYWNRKERHEG